ncbi:MAG: nucleotidyltransferase domain-containing protein [Thermodesulfobacteriota bacterium]
MIARPAPLDSQVFAAFPEIEAVYLFGSKADDRANALSDTDFAVLTSMPPQPGFKLQLYEKLTRAGIDDADVVLLNDASILLRYEAVRLNRVVYQKPGFDRGRYYSRVVREYLDFQPLLNIQREAYKQRLLHGRS